MAQGDWRSRGTGLMSLKGYALTPQVFSISILVSGLVLTHPDKQYYNIPMD